MEQKIDDQLLTHKSPPAMDHAWLLSCALITGIAVFLRFYDLGLRPFHHDEGVNGWFLTTLFNDGVYKYDPANYHGPTLYYIALLFTKVFGLETVPVRWSVAIFGVLTVVLAFFLRRYIGRVGALFAALFLALSPGMVFISRYFIHEMFFVFLSLALVAAVVFFIENRRAGKFAVGWAVILLVAAFLPTPLALPAAIAGENEILQWVLRVGIIAAESALLFFVIRMLLVWRDGRPIYLLLASACVSLLFATKETAFITLGTMLIAVFSVFIWRKIYAGSMASTDIEDISDDGLTWRGFREAVGSGADMLLILTAAAAVFIYFGVLLFSSFFTYPDGVQKAFEAYAMWSKTSSKDHTQSGTFAYLKWAWEIEAPILLLSALGTLIAFLKARHRFAMFVGLWAFGIFAAYSIIPYKTPWLALSFLLPMCIAAGYAINELTVSKNRAAKYSGVLLAMAASAILAFQAWELNFIRYDDEEMPYVYAHTKREFLDMVREIDILAEKSGKEHDAVIDVVSPDYWPLVWYLKDYEKAVYHGRMINSSNADMIVAKKGEQDAAVARNFSAKYVVAGYYPLRPGVELVLLVRRD